MALTLTDYSDSPAILNLEGMPAAAVDLALHIVGCHQTRCHRSCAIKRPSDGSIDIETSTVQT